MTRDILIRRRTTILTMTDKPTRVEREVAKRQGEAGVLGVEGLEPSTRGLITGGEAGQREELEGTEAIAGVGEAAEGAEVATMTEIRNTTKTTIDRELTSENSTLTTTESKTLTTMTTEGTKALATRKKKPGRNQHEI